MRYRDLKTIYYRSMETVVDLHKNKTTKFSDELKSIKGSERPEMLKTDVKDFGTTVTGNILLYIPIAFNTNFSVNKGDGVYRDGDDINSEPIWIVSNIPVKMNKHYLLLLENKVG